MNIDTGNVDIRPYQAGDDVACAELMADCYGEEAVEEKMWRQSHFGLEGTPNGMMVAEAATRIVGMQPMECYQYSLCGEGLRGAVLTGVMVHPDFRQRRIFSRLVAECETRAWDLGADFVTTMPNDLSRPGFLKRGYIDPGERTPLVLPLSPDRIARRVIRPAGLGRAFGTIAGRTIGPRKVGRLGKSACREVSTFGADVEMLTSRFAREWPGLVQLRNKSWLAWRFDDSNGRAYRRFVSSSESGEVSALAVTTHEKREGLDLGYLVDVVGTDDQSTLEVTGFAVSALQDAGMGLTMAVVSSRKLAKVLRSIGFWRIPLLVSPKRFYTVFLPRPGREDALRNLRRIENWYQTLADWDSI